MNHREQPSTPSLEGHLPSTRLLQGVLVLCMLLTPVIAVLFVLSLQQAPTDACRVMPLTWLTLALVLLNMGILTKVAMQHQRLLQQQKLTRVLVSTQGGLYQRIDENRELVELLKSECPSFVDRQPWVIGWLRSQDAFLLGLEFGVPDSLKRIFSDRDFPRPWPEDH